MKKKAGSATQIIVFTAIGVALVWLSIHNIPDDSVAQTREAFTKANYGMVFLSMLLGISAHVVRAWRWNALLHPLGYKISFYNAFSAVMIGYVVNYAIPRAGELSRCGVASRYGKIPFSIALGTVITERIIDVLLLFVLFFFTLAFQFKELLGLTQKYLIAPLKDSFAGKSEYLLVFAGLLFVLVLLIYWLRKKIKSLLGRKLGKFAANFFEGLKSVKGLKHPGRFILESTLIWVCYFLSLYVCFWCFPEMSGLGLKSALSVLLFGTIGVMVSPGGIGAYQFITTQVLLFYAISIPIANAFPWIVWGAQLIAIVVIGAICFILLPILNRNQNEFSKNQ